MCNPPWALVSVVGCDGKKDSACKLNWYNFLKNPHVRLLVGRIGWLVYLSFGLSKFPKRTVSYTSMVLSELI